MPTDENDQDLAAAFSPLRASCAYEQVVDDLAKLSKCRTMTDEFFCLSHLINGCVEFVEDQRVREEVESDLSDGRNNFTSDFLHVYRAEASAGVPYTIILEDEYKKLVPVMRKIWGKVLRAMIQQQLLPWTITDSERQLEGTMIDNLMIRMNSRSEEPLRDVTPKPERLTASGGLIALAEHGIRQVQDSKETSEEDAKEIPSCADKNVRVEAMASDPPRSERRPRRRLIEPVKQLPDGVGAGLPADYRLPPELDQDVFRDFPEDDDIDFNTYIVSDEELNEASKIWKRALGRKMAEKREQIDRGILLTVVTSSYWASREGFRSWTAPRATEPSFFATSTASKKSSSS